MNDAPCIEVGKRIRIAWRELKPQRMELKRVPIGTNWEYKLCSEIRTKIDETAEGYRADKPHTWAEFNKTIDELRRLIYHADHFARLVPTESNFTPQWETFYSLADKLLCDWRNNSREKIQSKSYTYTVTIEMKGFKKEIDARTTLLERIPFVCKKLTLQ